MPFSMTLDEAQEKFPELNIVEALPRSGQKAAFVVEPPNGPKQCLKIFPPHASLRRVEREILAMQKIDHPNVVRVLRYELTATRDALRHYLLEEYIEGRDLTDDLNQTAPWETERAAPFFVQIASALEQFELNKIVHRDLKPANIRVRPDGSPVIIDFGLARHLDLNSLTLTDQGAALGTLPYFAPEQFTGTKHDIDGRTDLFSLGVILFQALTNTHPFWEDGMARDELQLAVCSSSDFLTSDRFRGLPRAWQVIIMRLLQKERARRPASASVLLELLERAAAA